MPYSSPIMKNKRARERRDLLRYAVICRYGGKCANPACQWLNPDGTRGCRDFRCLQVDHVFNDAPEDKTIYGVGRGGCGGSIKFLRFVLEDNSGRYQILCSNCNWIKRSSRGRFQHGN